MKLLTLLGHKMTFAGSALLENRNLDLDKLTPLLEHEVLVPDIREAAASFLEFAHIKAKKKIPQYVLERAKALDKVAKKTIPFVPGHVYSLFRTALTGFLSQRESTPIDNFELILNKLNDAESMTLGDVKALSVHLSRPQQPQFVRMAEFLWCTTGAEVVGAELLIPDTYSADYLLMPDNVKIPRHLQSGAMRQLFEYFSFDVEALDRLSFAELLEVRKDSRVIQATNKLRGLTLDVPTTFDRDERQLLNSIIKEACDKETKLAKYSSPILDFAWDQVPVVSSIVRRLLKFRYSIGKKRYFAPIGKSITPFVAFSSYLQDKTSGRQAEA